MIQFEHLDKRISLIDWVGYLPGMLDASNPAPAVVQLSHNYISGWNPMDGFVMMNHLTGVLTYPGDPALRPVAKAKLRDETIFVYESGWVTIVQPDGSFEAARLD